MKARKQVPLATAADARRTWTQTDAEKILDEWATSGESLATFARGRGIVPQRLAWWRKRLAFAPVPRETTATSDATATFIPLTLRTIAAPVIAVPDVAAPDIAAPAIVTIEPGGGVRVELRALDGASAAWVASLVRALGAAT